MIYSRVSLDKNEISDQPATTSERSTNVRVSDGTHEKLGA